MAIYIYFACIFRYICICYSPSPIFPKKQIKNMTICVKVKNTIKINHLDMYTYTNLKEAHHNQISQYMHLETSFPKLVDGYHLLLLNPWILVAWRFLPQAQGGPLTPPGCLKQPYLFRKPAHYSNLINDCLLLKWCFFLREKYLIYFCYLKIV